MISSSSIRAILRWIHIMVGVPILGYIYINSQFVTIREIRVRLSAIRFRL